MQLSAAKKAKRSIEGAFESSSKRLSGPRISVSKEHLEGLVQGARELLAGASKVKEYMQYFDKMLPIAIDDTDEPFQDAVEDPDTSGGESAGDSGDDTSSIESQYLGEFGWYESRMYFVEGIKDKTLCLRPLVDCKDHDKTTCSPTEFTLYSGSLGLNVEMVVVPKCINMAKDELTTLDYSIFPWNLYFNEPFVDGLDCDMKSKLWLMMMDFTLSTYGCPIYALQISRACFPDGAILLPVVFDKFLEGYPSDLVKNYKENLSAARESAKLIFMNSLKTDCDDDATSQRLFPTHLMTSSMYCSTMKMAFATPRIPMEEVQMTKALLEASISSAEVIATQFALTRRVRAAAVDANQALMRCSPPSAGSNSSWEPDTVEENDVLEGLFKQMTDTEVTEFLNTDDWDAIDEDSDMESDVYDDVEPTENLAESFKAVYSQITSLENLVRGCSLRCIVQCCVMQGVSVTFLQFMCMAFRYNRPGDCKWRKGKVNSTGVSTLQRRIDTVLKDGDLDRVKDIDKIMKKLERSKVSYVLDKINIDFQFKDTANRYRSNLTFGDIADSTYLMVSPIHRGRTALVLGPYLFDSRDHAPIIQQPSLIRGSLDRAFHPKFPFVMKGPPEKGISTLWHPFAREKMVGLMSRVVDKKAGAVGKRKAGSSICRDDYTLYRFGFTTFIVNRRPLVHRERVVNFSDPRTDSQAVATIAFEGAYVTKTAVTVSPIDSKKKKDDEVDGDESESY